MSSGFLWFWGISSIILGIIFMTWELWIPAIVMLEEEF